MREQEEANRKWQEEAKARLDNEDESDSSFDDDEDMASHDSFVSDSDGEDKDNDKARQDELSNMRKVNPDLAEDILKAREDM